MNAFHRLYRVVTFGCLIATLLSSLSLVPLHAHAPAQSNPQDSLVVRWNLVALQAIRDTRPGPTIVARALAIVHTCIFDAWAAYDAKAVGTRLLPLRRPTTERTTANKSQAISFAAYRALVDLFPSETSKFSALMIELGYDPNDTSTDTTTPTGIGNVACAAALSVRHQDGSNQLGDRNPGAYSDYTNYTAINTPDSVVAPFRWQPLRVSNGQGGFVVQRFTTPQWGMVLPFALESGAQYRPRIKPQKLQRQTEKFDLPLAILETSHLDDRRKAIVEYWADGPSTELPPGHWNLFAQFVSQRDQHTLDEDVKLFFTLTNAVFDAGIAAWDAKRSFDFVRPITAIRYFTAGKVIPGWQGPGQGNGLILGETWTPYQPATVVTPPFPEFVSGHSTFSAAGAYILRKFTGSNRFDNRVTIAAGSLKVEPGIAPSQPVTLSWGTFTEAANQAGLSRRYGGIHFITGDLTGRMLGRKVGKRAWKIAQRYIDGSAKQPTPLSNSVIQSSAIESDELDVTLRMVAEVGAIQAGQTVTLTINSQGASDLSAFTTLLSYDASALELVAGKVGSVVAGNESDFSVDLVSQEVTADSPVRLLTFSAESEETSIVGLGGESELAVFTFKALADGAALPQLEAGVVVDAGGQAVGAEIVVGARGVVYLPVVMR